MAAIIFDTITKIPARAPFPHASKLYVHVRSAKNRKVYISWV